MQLKYGNHTHDAGEAEVMISREGLVSEMGRMFAIRERWEVQGRLHEASSADLSTAIDALITAYSYQGQDIELTQSEHAMRSGDTLNGTRVVSPPHFPQGRGGEYSTYRNYNLAVEGEFAYVGNSILLSWTESLTFTGTGGPVWGFLECLNGPPQQQMFMQQSVVHATQRGSAVCVPDSLHRNEYGFFWVPPEPIWPQWEHRDKKTITYELPADLYGKRITNWSYEFSANVPLGAFPNATGGIQFHLG
jgi:hypothetical protein